MFQIFRRAQKVGFVQKIRIFARIEDRKQRILVRITFALSALLALISLSGQPVAPFSKSVRPVIINTQSETAWADSLYQTMSFEERIGQLVMLRAHSDKGYEYEQAIAAQVTKYKAGGLCFFQGTPVRQAELTNQYQSSLRVPMLIAIDGEWGLGMRLKETISYPKQIAMGAIADHHIMFEYGEEVAKQCKRIGINCNFGPVADINNNPGNPVINDRSFGEDRENVTQKAIGYALGMQAQGVLACGKHFPGHGDTDTDSHEALPILHHSTYRLDSLELYPFRKMIEAKVGSMMVAHLNIPSIDNRKNRPSTLSDRIVTRLLRKSMGFDGVIFTDAMEMKGVTKFFKPGEADVAAIKAGNDVILLPENVDACFTALYKAARNGELPADQVEASVKRVLAAKYRCGLNNYKPIEISGINAFVQRPEAMVFKRKLYRKALTLVRDPNQFIPVQSLENKRFASVAVGAENSSTRFQQSLDRYTDVTDFQVPKNLSAARQASLLDSLKAFDFIFVSMHDMSRKPALKFGLAPESIQFVKALSAQQATAVTIFGNPYSLRDFEGVDCVLVAYDEDIENQDVTAQALFGASDITGHLPVTVTANAVYAQGVERVSESHRLAYDLPESQGLNSATLKGIDSLAEVIIGSGASPSCQVLVARKGSVIMNKSYGFQDYSRTMPVNWKDLYDLASVTKVASTTLATMRMDEQGLIQTSMPMSTYVPGLLNTDKSHLRVDEMLAHHSGLKAWIPFYKNTLDASGYPDAKYYRTVPEGNFNVFIAPNLYMDYNYIDTIWNDIYTSELRAVKAYKYSDLGLYLSKQMVENVSHRPIQDFNRDYFYGPLGATNTNFNPIQTCPDKACVPSEHDRYFRHKEIKGSVHDMGAAMLGGVGGHAGLFSNANDLAKIFQMLLNGGSYFGRRYLQEATIQKYTTRYPGGTRRGLGFDMKELNYQAQQNQCKSAPDGTFGHLGFTGTCVWADPENELIVIVLANRTYPSMDNSKFITEDYRPKIQEIVYQALAAGRVAP
jgi:beta-N-acetylhexosaminidase